MMPDNGTPNADAEGAWARAVPVRLGEALVAVALLVTGVFFAWQASLLDFGRVGLPGPGFFPFALGIILALMALAIFYRVWRGADDGALVFVGHRDVVISLLAMAGLAAAFERFDSFLVLGLFTAFLLLVVARTTLIRLVLGATLGMVAVYLFFVLALGVRLPTGDFWQSLIDLFAARASLGQP